MKTEIDKCGDYTDYRIYFNNKYIGLITDDSFFGKYRIVLDARYIGKANNLIYAKLKLIFKYFIKKLFKL